MTPHPQVLRPFACGVAIIFMTWFPADAATLIGTFSSIPGGSNVDLTLAGPVDWVHWGLYTETSLDRKAGVTPTPFNLPTRSARSLGVASPTSAALEPHLL